MGQVQNQNDQGRLKFTPIDLFTRNQATPKKCHGQQSTSKQRLESVNGMVYEFVCVCVCVCVLVLVTKIVLKLRNRAAKLTVCFLLKLIGG